MSRTQSTIGASQHYGPRTTAAGLPNSVSTYGLVRQVEVYVDYTEANAGLPTANADDDRATLIIPAGSFIKNAYFEVTSGFTSTGSATLELGFQSTSGGTVDANGLDSLAVSLLTDESWHVLDGADVGAGLSVDAQISIDDATAVFSAGAGRLIVEYIEKTVG